MWNLFRMELKYEVYTNINFFFRFIKNIKPLRNKFSDSFHYRGLKSLGSALSGIYKVLKSLVVGIFLAFFTSFIFAFLSNLMKPGASDPGVMVTFFVVTYILMNLMQSTVLGATQKIHLFHEVFRQSARDVARIELFITPLFHFIGRSAGFLLVFSGVISPLLAIGLSFLITAFGAATEWIHLKCLVVGRTLSGNPIFLFIVMGIAIFAMIVVNFLSVNILPLLWTPPAWILTLVLFAVFSLATWNYKDFNQVAQHVHGEYEKQISLKANNGGRTIDVQLKDSDYGDPSQSAAVKETVANLSGYAKLNALFFARHKRILRKPIMIFTYIALALGGVGLIFLWFNRTLNIWHPFKIGVFYDSLGFYIPFFMYLSIGDKRLTKSLFVNCDASLLTYSFYRRPEDILTSYNLRLREVIKLNRPPALALMGSLSIWLFLSGMAITPARLILFPLIMAYYVFFTIHLLFVYYILQPYTQDVEVKSPLYSVISGIVYMFCYMPMIIKPNLMIHAIFILILTLLYGLTARVLIPKLAPNNFRLK